MPAATSGLGRMRRSGAAVTVLFLIASALVLSGTSPAATPKTKITLAAFPGAVDVGSSTTLSGHVKWARKACVKTQKVQLRSVAPGSPTTVATSKANKRGTFAFTVPVDAAASFQAVVSGSRKCRGARSKIVAVEAITPPPPELEGPDASPARNFIHNASFPAIHPDDLAYSEETGAVMSTTEFLLVPKQNATVGDFNALLETLGANIVGGNPDVGWVLVQLDGDHTPEQLLEALDLAEGDPAIDMAVPEVVLEDQRIPGTDPNPSDPPGPETSPEWTWEITPFGGNWYLEATRAPQAWNLNQELVRSQTVPGFVADLDDGFDAAHPDLFGKLTIETLGGRNANPAETLDQGHGTATAGIIAARFGNYQGLDGVSPVLELDDGTSLGGVIGLPIQRATSRTPAEVALCRDKALVHPYICFSAVTGLRLIDDFVRMHAAHPEIRIYNASQGLGFDQCAPQLSTSWMAAGKSGTPEQQAAAKRLVVRLGEAFAKAFPDLNAAEKNVIWFASAGNGSDLTGNTYPVSASLCQGVPDADRDGRADIDLDGNPDTDHNGKPDPPDDPGVIDIDAKYNSPACAAALTLKVRGIFCVESTTIDPGFPRANSSNGNGNLSAPGDAIAVLAPRLAPSLFHPFRAKGSVDYPGSGTSFAAPLAAGIANYLDVFGNRGPFRDRPQQELSARDLYDHLLKRSVPGVNRAPMIDFYYALTTLGAVGDLSVQRALVDVDDGSRFDGNARLDNDDEDGDDKTQEVYPKGIATEDAIRGDGEINMKDFRAFRDAFLTSSVLTGLINTVEAGDVLLDGFAQHFKNDLNFDSCVNKSRANFFDVPTTLPEAPSCLNAPDESVFSRFDFNGDGEVNGLSNQPVPSIELVQFQADPSIQCNGLNDPPDCLRDIDVLALSNIWDASFENVSVEASDPGDCTAPDAGWQPVTDLMQDEAGRKTALPDDQLDYLLSADLHFDIGKDPTNDMEHVYLDVDSEIPPNSTDDDGDGKTDEPFEASFHRCLDIGPKGGKTLVTVPLFTGRVLVTVIGEDLDVDGDGAFTEDPYAYRDPETGSGDKVRYGEDVVFKIAPTR